MAGKRSLSIADLHTYPKAPFANAASTMSLSVFAETIIGRVTAGNILVMNTEKNYVRSGRRMNSRARVTLEWTEGGEAMRVAAITIDISPYGCFVLASEGVVVGQQVRITNSANGQSASGRVVRHGQQSAAGWELGIRLDGPSEQLWGLDF